MPKIARVLLYIKILGIMLGVGVTALTLLMQREADKTADTLAMSAIKWEVPRPPEKATPAERELFFAKLTQKWIFDNVQEIRNAQQRRTFIETMLSYAPAKYLAILGGFCLILGESWQFFRDPNKKDKNEIISDEKSSEENPSADDKGNLFRFLIEKADYYRKFHHSLITWYITIQGFVFAGLLASRATGCAVGIICLSLVISALILFVSMIGVFSDRISILEEYISRPYPPKDWRRTHIQDAGFCLRGQGSWFFALVCVMFAMANVALLLSKEML